MKKLIALLLLPAVALGDFERAHDADSVVFGSLCTYAQDGIEKVDIDFDTPNLLITIDASGDGVDQTFSYSGGNIVDYDGAPPAWGNPTTNAVEVEDKGQCIRLHIRDEVLEVAGATEWTILIEDTTGTPTFIDAEYRVRATSPELKTLVGGTVLFETVLDDISTPQIVGGPDDPGVNNWHINKLACIEDVTNGNIDCAWITAYDAVTDRWSLSRPLRFTIAVGDILRILPVERSF